MKSNDDFDDKFSDKEPEKRSEISYEISLSVSLSSIYNPHCTIFSDEIDEKLAKVR